MAVTIVSSVVGGLAVLFFILWLTVFRHMKGGQAVLRELVAELAASGERVEIPPERGNYSGSTTGTYGNVRGTGAIALTDKRLAFRKQLGAPVDVARAQIVGAREAKGWNGERVGGRSHVVVQTSEHGEVGFLVADPARWLAALAPR